MSKLKTETADEYRPTEYQCVRYGKSVPRRISKYHCIENLAGTKEFNTMTFRIRFPDSNRHLITNLRLALPVEAKFYRQTNPANLADDGRRQVSCIVADYTDNNQANIAVSDSLMRCFASVECYVN